MESHSTLRDTTVDGSIKDGKLSYGDAEKALAQQRLGIGVFIELQRQGDMHEDRKHQCLPQSLR